MCIRDSNKADNYFDHDSAIDNTIEDIGGDLAKWLDDNFGKVKSVLIVVGSIVLLCFVLSLIHIWHSANGANCGSCTVSAKP